MHQSTTFQVKIHFLGEGPSLLLDPYPGGSGTPSPHFTIRPTKPSASAHASPELHPDLRDSISVFSKKISVKAIHTRYRALGPELIPVYRHHR